MKYIRFFEELTLQKYKIGDYVRLNNPHYLYATVCRMNNCDLNTIFKVIAFNDHQANGDISDEQYCISLLNDNEFEYKYLWVSEESIDPVSEMEMNTLKYNL